MKILFFLSLLIMSIWGYSQINLVPNPSFEELDSCPTFGNQLYLADPWYAPDGTADLYNVCATTWNWQVPENQFGYQEARTGDGYVGGVMFPTGGNFEYIGVQLESPLTSGEVYTVSFYVSLSNEIYSASNNIGAYFSETAIIEDIQLLDITPQVNGTEVITDLENWTLVEGEFTADGGEEYMTIGNFFTLEMTDTVHLPTTSQPVSYYYIDDVSVYLQEDGQNSIASENWNQQIKLSSNPITNQGYLIFESYQTDLSIQIFNSIGQEIMNSTFSGTQLALNKSELGKGLFYITIEHPDYGLYNCKVVMQ